MAFKSKFASVCPACKQRIEVGSYIEQYGAKGYAHLVCPVKQYDNFPVAPVAAVVRESLYDGTCVRCRGAIAAGTIIEWTKAEGAWHVECYGLPIAPKPQVEEAPASNVPDGRYSVVFADGSYQTVRFKTPVKGNFIGKQLVSYVTGYDEWQAFGVNTANGVQVWGRFKQSESLTRWLEAVKVVAGDPKAAALAYALESGNCSRCGRLLTVPASLNAGMGPECASKGAW